jgi:steroid delta-isomerase-like uncharacterized protein
MSVDVKRMLEDYVAAWNSGDAEKVASFCTDDCVLENLGGEDVHRSKQEMKARAARIFAAIPDFRMEVKSLFIAGDWVGCEWVETGTQTGDLSSLPAHRQELIGKGRFDPRSARGQDQAGSALLGFSHVSAAAWSDGCRAFGIDLWCHGTRSSVRVASCTV